MRGSDKALKRDRILQGKVLKAVRMSGQSMADIDMTDGTDTRVRHAIEHARQCLGHDGHVPSV